MKKFEYCDMGFKNGVVQAKNKEQARKKVIKKEGLDWYKFDNFWFLLEVK